MKKKKDNTLLLTSVVCLLPMLLSLAVYRHLPEQVAVHWNFAGEPDGYLPRVAAAFGLPVLMLGINLFSILVRRYDPKRANTSRTVQLLASWTPPVLSLLLVPATLFIALGVEIPIPVVVPVLVGAVLVLFGNYLPKNRQNYTVGIRLPWTLHDADNWNKTHRMAGYLWMVGGGVMMAGPILWRGMPSEVGVILVVVLIFVLVAAPTAYSYWLYRKAGGGEADGG